MYLDFFGLTEEPFSLTPDPRFIYLSRQHEVAAESLIYGINHRKGFLLLTGEIGTGKTTLCRELMNRLDEKTAVSVILNPMMTTEGLLSAINDDFGNKIVAGGADEKLQALHKFLLEANLSGRNAIVLIDEAQNLSIESLEMVRLLSNLETDTRKLLQIILVGQPELENMLASYRLRQLNQRISVRQRLGTLSYQEFREYIYHRLFIAGARGNINFKPSALRLIYKLSKGFPRVLNNLCDRILLAAFAKGVRTVNRRLVKEGFADLNGQLFCPWWRFWACQ